MLRFLEELLTRPVAAVIADMRRSIAGRALSPTQRKPVDACIQGHCSMVPTLGSARRRRVVSIRGGQGFDKAT
jgi:hypothetical protein